MKYLILLRATIPFDSFEGASFKAGIFSNDLST